MKQNCGEFRGQKTYVKNHSVKNKNKNKKTTVCLELWVKISENPKDFQYNIRNQGFLSYKVCQ